MNEDLSSIFDKLNINPESISPDMINALSGMFNNSNADSSNENSSTDSESSFNGMDFDTILKMKGIFEKMNSSNNDPRTNLLKSLKPYLSDDKKSKVDQYIQFIKISKALEGFDFMGGGKKNDGKL